jgi:hypothetical protein
MGVSGEQDLPAHQTRVTGGVISPVAKAPAPISFTFVSSETSIKLFSVMSRKVSRLLESIKPCCTCTCMHCFRNAFLPLAEIL